MGKVHHFCVFDSVNIKKHLNSVKKITKYEILLIYKKITKHLSKILKQQFCDKKKKYKYTYIYWQFNRLYFR